MSKSSGYMKKYRASKSGEYNGIPIPKIRNPAGIPSNAITRDEYLAAYGLSSPVSGYGVDKIGGANMTRLSQKQREKTFRDIETKQAEYSENRQSAIKDYNSLVSAGVIRDKTNIEKVVTKAHGNPDNQSTHAARRMADKYGVDWRTGKKKKK